MPVKNARGFGPYSIDPATNRLLNGSDLSYYPNGSLMTSNGHSFWYTAEGYLRSIDSFTTGSYLYNALGERTLSVRNDQGDHSNYSASENVYLNSQPMAESHSDSAGAPWVWTNYVYANGQKIAQLVGNDPTTPAVNYYLDDQLGTAQMEVSSNGTPTWSGWYTPFGQEITSGWPSNYIGNQPNDGTSMRYKFTGKERDAESGLDYFGARYYASNMGRWMSPDWADKPEAVPYSSLANPQSLNLYGYVGNNPLSRADADGHEWRWGGAESQSNAAVLLMSMAINYATNGRYQKNFDSVANSSSFILTFGDHSLHDPGVSGGDVTAYMSRNGPIPNPMFATGSVDVTEALIQGSGTLDAEEMHEASHGGDWVRNPTLMRTDVLVNGENSATEIRAGEAEHDNSTSPRSMTLGDALNAVQSAFHMSVGQSNPVPLEQSPSSSRLIEQQQ